MPPSSASSERATKLLEIQTLRQKNLTGTALRYIREGCGFTQEQFAEASKKLRNEKTGRMISVKESVGNLERMKRPRQIYATVMEYLVGAENYEKWLLIIHREKPHLLLEATTIRGRRAAR